jgi:hypothetical protein
MKEKTMKLRLTLLAAGAALILAAPASAAPTRHVYGSGTYVDNPGYTTASFTFDATGSGNDASGTMDWQQHIPTWTQPYEEATADVVCIDVVGDSALVVGRITSATYPNEIGESLTFLMRDGAPQRFVGSFGDASYQTHCNVTGWVGPRDALTSGSFSFQHESAPVAADDAYSVAAGTKLNASPGVLSNDSDPDGDALTAAVATSPAHGAVAFEGDGSFTYMPNAGYAGPDSFTYTATDGRLKSTATVSITVAAPPDSVPPVTTIALAPAAPDGSNGWYRHPVQVNVTATDGSGSGVAETRCVFDPATAPSSFADLSAGCTAPWTLADGVHAVYAASVDYAGNVESIETAAFKVDTTSPVVAFSSHPASYTVDEQVTISCSASDPSPGSGLAASTCDGASLDVPAYTLGLGSHTLSATATDDAGNVGTGSTTFDVVVTPASLENVVRLLVADHGIASSLLAKIDAGNVAAFDHEVDAQTGKKISAADAALLKQLAAAL